MSNVPPDPYPGGADRAASLLSSVAAAARMLAIWRAAETGATREITNSAELKGVVAKVHDAFMQTVYTLAFDLVPLVLVHGPIVTKNETGWRAVPDEGGFLELQLEPGAPGHLLVPHMDVPVESFLQLIIDLPEILDALGVV